MLEEYSSVYLKSRKRIARVVRQAADGCGERFGVCMVLGTREWNRSLMLLAA